MSKILRRPMFRGGGKISSYGTGIAAPLVQGYKGGGQIGGGIIAGRPMADGRYGFQAPEIKLGGEILKENVPKYSFEDLVAAEDLSRGTVYDEDFIKEKFKDYTNRVGRNVTSGGLTETDLAFGMQVAQPPSSKDVAFLELYEKDPDRAYELFKTGEVTGKNYEKLQADQSSTANIAGIDLGIKTDTAATELTDEQKEINRLNKIIANNAEKKEEPTTLSARDMVAQNKALFADLLGSKEARGKDISDMLLGFAGAEGDTLGEKFKDFTRIEAKRPGKVEKINEAAAALAINDYVAGKRAKEQGDAIRGKIDYEYGKKLENAIPDVEDSYEVVSAKLNSMEAKPGSDKAIRAMVNMKDKTANVVVKSDIKLAELVDKPEKVLKKLDKGYNIVSDGLGNKRVIKYDGSGGIKGIEILTIQELWEG
jgi:hypothetical protein